MNDVPECLAAAVLRLDLRSRPGVVAVSGGADSVALVSGLNALGGLTLSVGHFHHHIRGPAADADAAFVRALAARFDLPFHLGHADVPAAGGNLEAAGRRLRYAWLADLAERTGAGWVATGHTADDQAETVLFHLVRGTGLRGLRGIAEVRPLAPTVRLLRPMVAATRADVLAHLAAVGLPHREDATNADPAYTRARIRAELLPLLKTFNPAVVAALGRLAGQAADASARADAAVGVLRGECERPRAGDVVVLDWHRLAAEPAERIADLFRYVWEREGWPRDRLDAATLARTAAAVLAGTPAIDLPGGVRLRVAGGVVQLGRVS